MPLVDSENCLYDVTVNKRGQKVFHIWEEVPTSPIFKIFKYEYSVYDREKAPEKYRGIETKIVYKSIDFKDLTLVELQGELTNLKEVFEGNCNNNNPYYLHVVNLRDSENPRWYPLPLLFSPIREQEETNRVRGYEPLSREKIVEARELIKEYFNYKH